MALPPSLLDTEVVTAEADRLARRRVRFSTPCEPVPVPTTARIAWPGGTITSNKSAALSAFLARKRSPDAALLAAAKRACARGVAPVAAAELDLSMPPDAGVTTHATLRCTRDTVYGNCFVGNAHPHLSDAERVAVCDAFHAAAVQLSHGETLGVAELTEIAAGHGVTLWNGVSPPYGQRLANAMATLRGTEPVFECSPSCVGRLCHAETLLQWARGELNRSSSEPASEPAEGTAPPEAVVTAAAAMDMVPMDTAPSSAFTTTSVAGSEAVVATVPDARMADATLRTFDCADSPPAATVLVPMRVDGAELVLQPCAAGLAFGEAFASNEMSRDDAVLATNDAAIALLGADAPWHAFLAGEWVEPGIVWRVVLCLVGGELRNDMRAAALSSTSTTCESCAGTQWVPAAALGADRRDSISSAALARALVFVRPGPHTDARLHVGRGVELWADASLDAAAPRQHLLGARALEHAADAHRSVQTYLRQEASRLRAQGDEKRAVFFDGCAARVEPVPVREIPDGLVGDRLLDSDLEQLEAAPFRRNTTIHRTDPPEAPQRPSTFPSHLPTPTCHADFLLPEVVDRAATWHEAAEKWHCTRVEGSGARRQKGLAWGLDACKPEWRPFFEQGGVVLFDEHTGVPAVLTEASYPLSHGLRGSFARTEFAELLDQEIVSYFADGVCIKAAGLPFLQLASNLESLYDADDATGVECVARELHQFGQFNETGWYIRAPRPDRGRGVLATATLPSCNSPIGAVLKANGGTRIVIDMGFGYGQLTLETVTETPLPPDHTWLGGVHAPSCPRAHFSSITHSGGGGLAMPVNVASGPSKPRHGDEYVAGGMWPWPYEGKSTVAEQAHNDMILSVPAQRGGLFIFHLLWDEWKSFHQSNYHMYEIIATANVVPELDQDGQLARTLRGISNGRMAMGGLFASGINQRKGNASDWAVMRRFDRRQAARRFSEPEHPAVQQWLDLRHHIPHDSYGTQARLAFGGYYSDDPKYSVCGPPSRVGDLVHSFYDVMGPDGLNYRLADYAKWLAASWAAWQGVRMSAMLGIIWLPPPKAIKADGDLRKFADVSMYGSEFVKMMGFLNYLGEVLHVHGNINRLLWCAYDDHKLRCEQEDLSVGATVVQPGPAQVQPVKVWRRVVMNTPGTTLLRVVRRAPPPRDNVTLWEVSSDACMDVVLLNGTVVAKHGNAPGDHDPPGMGGFLHGLLWQYAFSAAEIEVTTIPVAEFMAGPVGLMVYDHEGLLEHAERIALAIDAEATPRGALQGEAHAPGLLIAHEEFVKLPVHKKYKGRLTGKHVFGKANDPADGASRQKNAEAEQLTRFLGLEPRWLPVPPEAREYVATVVARLRLVRRKHKPRTCDPATPGGDAPRFGDSPRPRSRRPRAASPSPLLPPSCLASPFAHSPGRTKKHKGRPSPLIPDGFIGNGTPPALSAGIGASPRLTRAHSRLHSPPLVALQPTTSKISGPAGLLLAAAQMWAAPFAAPPPASATVSAPGTSSFVVEQRVEHLLGVNASSNKPHAFRGDQSQLRDLLTAQVHAQARAANENSLAAEQSHFRLYWKPYCDLQRTPYVRPDVRSLTYDELMLEEAWWGGAIPWIQPRMPNGEGVMGAALPTSNLKVLRNMRRAHKRMGIDTVSLRAAVQATDGLLKDFLLEHGPLALVPKRKEPLLNDELFDMWKYGGYIFTGRKRCLLDWRSPRFSSLLAMFHTLAQTGMRKAEVSIPAKAKFDKSRASLLNLRWRIGGTVYDHLTPPLYERLVKEGGYALLRPPPSKADPFSLHWGPCTIYLRYSATERINSARELAREEMRRGVDPAKRADAPLFVKEDGTAWNHYELASTFYAIMVAIRGEARAKQVSMHSWRVYLACALLSQGASFATIQSMLRWRSEDALRIYARMNDFKYADWLTSAQGATISSVRTTTAASSSAAESLSRPPEPGTLAAAMRDAAEQQEAGTAEAGFQQEWRQRAVAAVDAAVREAHALEEQPEVDAYGRLEGLHGAIGALLIEAEKADEKDAAAEL